MQTSPTVRRFPQWLIPVAVFTLLLLLLSTRAVVRGLNHDEHQFLAPAALLAREGLLPYRDYPLFHFPHLVFVYAGLDWASGGELLLSAKLFNAVCSAGTLLLIGWAAMSALAETPLQRRACWLAAGALVTAILADPLFLYATGKTWNHEAPALLMIASIMLTLAGIRRSSAMLMGLAGLCGGLAVGCRLTYLTILPPLWALSWLAPQRRWLCAGSWGVGSMVGLLPAVYFYVFHRERFLFDNFEFPRLRELDPENTRIQKTKAPWRKVRYFFKEIVRPSWPLFGLYFAITIPTVVSLVRARAWTRSPVMVVLLLIPCFLVGCFLPSRYQYQHIFGIIPLVGLGVAYALAANRLKAQWKYGLLGILAALALFAGIRGYRSKEMSVREYVAFQSLIRREEWLSERIKTDGREIARLVGDGPVLTFAPTWPIGGGVQFYPEFATGPFAWRSAKFVSPARRETLHLVAPEDLVEFLRDHPPAGILTGFEEKALEAEFVAYAEENGFRALALRKRKLWVPDESVRGQ